MEEPRAPYRPSGHKGLALPGEPKAPALPLLAEKGSAESSSLLSKLPLLDAAAAPAADAAAAERQHPRDSGGPPVGKESQPTPPRAVGAKRKSPESGEDSAERRDEFEQQEQHPEEPTSDGNKATGKAGEDRPGHGRVYVPWSPKEEESLRSGVQRHGVGAWQIILRDPDFAILKNRTGIQLKDKWRNLIKFNHLTREETIMAARTSERKWKRPGAAAKNADDGGSPSAPNGARGGGSSSPPERASRSERDPPLQPPLAVPKLNIDFHRSSPPQGSGLTPAISRRLLAAISREEERERLASMERAVGGHSRDERSPARQRETNNGDAYRPKAGGKDKGKKSPRRRSPPESGRPYLPPMGMGLPPHAGQLPWLPGALADAPMHHWARWSEMHMASLVELRMLLTESLQIQAEADNSLLEVVAHFRCGAKGVESVHQALQICDIANDKVQLTYKLMDDWRRKICFESSGAGGGR